MISLSDFFFSSDAVRNPLPRRSRTASALVGNGNKNQLKLAVHEPRPGTVENRTKAYKYWVCNPDSTAAFFPVAPDVASCLCHYIGGDDYPGWFPEGLTELDDQGKPVPFNPFEYHHVFGSNTCWKDFTTDLVETKRLQHQQYREESWYQNELRDYGGDLRYAAISLCSSPCSQILGHQEGTLLSNNQPLSREEIGILSEECYQQCADEVIQNENARYITADECQCR